MTRWPNNNLRDATTLKMASSDKNMSLHIPHISPFLEGLVNMPLTKMPRMDKENTDWDEDWGKVFSRLQSAPSPLDITKYHTLNLSATDVYVLKNNFLFMRIQQSKSVFTGTTKCTSCVEQNLCFYCSMGRVCRFRDPSRRAIFRGILPSVVGVWLLCQCSTWSSSVQGFSATVDWLHVE